MLNPDLAKLIGPFQRTTTIIWSAFTMATLIYAGLGFLMQPKSDGQLVTTTDDPAVLVLVVVAAIVGIVLPWFVIPRVVPIGALRARSAVNEDRFEAQKDVFERLSVRDRERALSCGAIQSLYIIRWAAVESMAILGLVGLLMGKISLLMMWGFVAASFVSMLLMRPDYEAHLEQS